MTRQVSALVVLALGISGAMLVPPASADALGSADSFAVLAGSTVANNSGTSNPTIIDGDVGVSPGSAVTGFPPGQVTPPWTIYSSGAVPATAQGDVTSAFSTLAAEGAAGTLVPGGILTGTYSPGYYDAPAASLTGTIYLNDGGVADSVFVFYSSSTLTTASGSLVDVSGLSPTDSVYWVVGSSATLGGTTGGSVFEGNILASTSISFNPGAQDLCGRALAGTGGVTFAGASPATATGVPNEVSIGCSSILPGSNGLGGGLSSGVGGGTGPVATPEPGTLGLVLAGFCVFCFFALRGHKQTARSMDFC
jgi:hypothetical protein